MATYNQISRLPVTGGDLTFKNYSVADIPAGTAVLFDGTNKGDVNNPPGIVVPTASAGVAKTCGITVENIKASGVGRVCVFGGAVGVSYATLNPGDFVEISDTTSHMGEIIASTSTHEVLGRALTAAVAGDPILVWVNSAAHN